MSAAAEIVKHNLEQSEFKNLDFRLNAASCKILALNSSAEIHFPAPKKWAALSSLIALVSVEATEAVGDILPISFFQNFQANIDSAKESATITGWDLMPIKTDNNQFIYQFKSAYPVLCSGLTKVTLEPVLNDNYQVTLLNGVAEFITLQVL